MYTREHLLLRIDAIELVRVCGKKESESRGKRAGKREIVNDGGEKDGKDRKGTKGEWM